MKRRVFSALCCLMLFSALTMTAFGIEVPDLERKGSISITMTHQGEAVPGGSLTLYRIAEVHLENEADYSFRYIQEYAECQVSLEDLGNSETALALAAYTKENNISGTKQFIDEEGQIIFAELELGLYLIVQQDAAPGFELVNPFLVTVPGKQDDHYIYNVDASPKLALERAPTEPTEPTDPTEPTEPTPPDLPQTGLNQWPVPVLAISGMFMVGMGLVLYADGKKKSHES